MLGSKRTKQLEPRVTVAANVLAIRLGMDADEAEQEIWRGICERAHQDKTFLKQTDGYIVQGGVYAALNEWQKRQTRERRCVPEEAATSVATDNHPLAHIRSRAYLERLMRRLE